MSGLGIGLGSFMSGFQQGAGIRAQIDDNRAKQKQKADLAQIQKDAEAKFEDMLSDDAYDYMMRRQAMVYLRNGEPEKAEKLRAFSEEASTRRGTKLFAGALRAFQLGDHKSGMSLLEQLMGVDGYGPKGAKYEFIPVEEGPDSPMGAGTVINMTGANGEKGQTFVPRGQEADALRTVAAPEVRLEARLAEEQRQKQRQEGMEDYERKKEIDARHSQKNVYSRQDAIRDLEKAYPPDSVSGEPAFAAMPAETQKRLIAERMQLMQGGSPDQGAVPASEPQRSFFNDKTGERRQLQDAAGLAPGTVGAGAAPAGVGGGQPAAGLAGLGSSGAHPRPTPRPSPEHQPKKAAISRQDLLAEAAAQMAGGGSPESIARGLLNAGVARNEWPEELKGVYPQPAALGR